MINFAFGALAMLAVVTFAPPAVAAWPSEKLRDLVDRIRGDDTGG